MNLRRDGHGLEELRRRIEQLEIEADPLREKLEPIERQLRALRRSLAGKIARAARAEKDRERIAYEERLVAQVRGRMAGVRGTVPIVAKELDLHPRTVHRRLRRKD